MASTYTTRNRLEKQGTGENDDTWGTKLNTLFDLVDEGMEGYLSKSIAGSSDTTLTSSNGSSDESRQRVLKFTGDITANVNVICPATEKFYVVWNATNDSEHTVTFKPSGGTGLEIPRGCIGAVFTDGSTMYQVSPWIAADNTNAMPIPNLLPNGECKIWQRGTTFTSASSPANNDDTYLMDGCVLLSDGNDVVDVDRDTSVKPTGAYASMKFTVATANKKFGVLFPLEALDAAAVIGGKASISFKARDHSGNATLETLRCALIAWNSTADSITSDVVSAWNSAGVNPTLATNWTNENTPTSLTLTASFAEIRVNAIDVDTSSATNVALFIWVDDTDATVGDIIYLADFQIVPGPVATPIQRKTFGEDLRRCQRYFVKTFPQGTAPAQNGGVAGALSVRATDAGSFVIDWRLPVEMRGAPTITTYNPSAANANARNAIDSTDTALSGNSPAAPAIRLNQNSASASDANDTMLIHVAATAEL